MPSVASTPRPRASDASSTPAPARTVSLPEYQPPAAPLNPAAQRALSSLLQQTHSLRRLKIHLDHASGALTDTAGVVNDRGTEVRDRYERRKERGGEEFDVDGQALEQTEAFEKRIEDITAGLEGQMRAMVDGAAWIESLNESVQSVSHKLGSQPASQTQTSTQRSRRGGGRAVADDEDDDEEGGGGDASEPTQTQTQQAPPPPQAPSHLLAESLKKRKADWAATSMTERYANNNAYIGFYRIVHDARHHGDEAPPVPHANTWFAEEDENNTLSAAAAGGSRKRKTGGRQQQQQQQESDDDDDVEIARERISVKCPITLLPFKEPLTSTKCPHSFEKAAILEMIQHSSLRGPPAPSAASQSQGRRAPLGDKAVRCPVCSMLLTATDLAPDPVLLRKVKRLEAAAEREERGGRSDEDDDEEDGRDVGARSQIPRGTQRGAPEMLESSDVEGGPEARQQRRGRVPSSSEQVRLKRERASGVMLVPSSQLEEDVPGTQATTAGGAALVDLGEDEEEEGEEETEDEEDEEEDSGSEGGMDVA